MFSAAGGAATLACSVTMRSIALVTEAMLRSE
jgi:hypothetical protein